MSRTQKLQIAGASLVLGVITYYLWFYAAEWITGHPLFMGLYFAPIFTGFAICGKNCEGGVEIAAAAASIFVASLEWLLIFTVLRFAYSRFNGAGSTQR
jgi:xanthine/uracil permease